MMWSNKVHDDQHVTDAIFVKRSDLQLSERVPYKQIVLTCMKTGPCKGQPVL